MGFDAAFSSLSEQISELESTVEEHETILKELYSAREELDSVREELSTVKTLLFAMLKHSDEDEECESWKLALLAYLLGVSTDTTTKLLDTKPFGAELQESFDRLVKISWDDSYDKKYVNEIVKYMLEKRDESGEAGEGGGDA